MAFAMRHLPRMSIYVERPPEDVFAYVLDIERTPEWRPRMSKVRWSRSGETDVGSRFEVVVRMLGIPFSFDFEVTEWDPPRYFAYRQTDGLVKVDAAMEWIPHGDGCWFHIAGDNQTDNVFMKLATPVFRSSLLWQNYNDLVRLKAILEG